MNPLAQAAQDAAKKGEKTTVEEIIQQALSSKLDDIDVLFTLATLTDENTSKRQLLNRVLSLDATNKTAREMMLEMDRAEMNSYRSRSTQSASRSSSDGYTAQESYDIPPGKTRVFKYPKTWLILLGVFAVLSCCATLWFASITFTHIVSLPFLIMAVILGLTAITVSSRVEINETVIRMSAVYGSTEMKWGEITSIKWDPIRRNLELRSDIGELITIPAQLKGYRTIVEILRLKRPDLFSREVFPVPTATAQLPGAQQGNQKSVNPSAVQPASDPQPVARTVTPDPPALKPASEKPSKFKTSSVWLILFYVFMALSCLTGFLVASQNIAGSLPFFILGGLFGLTALSNTSNVEVQEEGIRNSSLFNGAEIQWNEISEIRSNSFRRTLTLTANNGKSLNISTQVKDYPVLVETIRRKRPDLFSEAKLSSPPQSVPSADNPPSPSIADAQPASPTLSETRTFQKGFFKQYGLLLVLIPLFFLFVWMALSSPESRVAFIVVAVVSLLFMAIPFIQVASLKVEPNKLTIETAFEAKELTAQQVKEIKMQSTRGRYGRVNNFVNVVPVEGKNYPLSGFSEGEEVIYGYLMNWWNAYKDR